MKTRCPCCGTTLSLDALVSHDGARAALAFVFGLSGELGSAVCKYLGLFRPAQRELSMDRVARLLEPISIDISAGYIERHGQTHVAPTDAWIWAIRQALDARDAGRLKTPLTGHGWLYEVITSWRPEMAQHMPVLTSDHRLPITKTARAIAVLQEHAQ